jgi:endonuclease/exonuclease/phosphatase family metal-dependent hydrolase
MKISRTSWRVIEAVAVLLFLFEAVRTLFSMLFGVIYDALFDGDMSFTIVGLIVGGILVALVSPTVLALLGRRASGPDAGRRGWFIAAMVAAAARIPLTLEDPQIRLVSAIVVLAAAGIYLAFLLYHRPTFVPVALVLALVVDQVARVYGHTWDVTLQPGFLPLQVLLCLGLGALAWSLHARFPEEPGEAHTDRVGGIGLAGGLALGALLFLETAALGLPNVLARWTGVDYPWAATGLVLVTALPLVPVAADRIAIFGGKLVDRLRESGVLVRLALLIVGVGALAVGRLGGGVLGLIGLFVAQMALLAILPLLTRPPHAADTRATGLGLAAGMLLFFVLQLLLAFAFTYPYTLSAFRSAGPVVLLVAAIIAFLPAALRAPDLQLARPAPFNSPLVVTVIVVAAAVFVWSSEGPGTVHQVDRTVRAATYNIHYGYDTDWHHTLEAQARAIEQSGADIVFLQEVDAGRLTSYGVDNALWLGRRLNMRAVFAPALEGLSGVAVLTHLSVTESNWSLLPSELEQTAMAHAQIPTPGGDLHAYGLWLGLEEPERMRQIQAAIDLIDNRELVLLGGDMNAEPDSPVCAALESAGFVDPFPATGNLPAYSDPAIGPHKRIDYVWARGLTPVEAKVSPSLASDHRLVVVEVSLP